MREKNGVPPTPKEKHKIWQDVKNKNPIVAAVLNSGGDITDCVIALAEHNAEIFKRIIHLENIAPRKFVVGGQTYIWRCPDDMVPSIYKREDN